MNPIWGASKHLHIGHLKKSLRFNLSRRILPKSKPFINTQCRSDTFSNICLISECLKVEVRMWAMSGQQSQNVSQQQQVPEKFLKPFYKLSVAQLNEAWKVNHEKYNCYYIPIWWAEGRSMETAVCKNWSWIGNGLASGTHLPNIFLNLKRALLCFFV